MIGTTRERLCELDSLYPEWEADTLWTRFEKNAERFRENAFIYYKDRVYTYGEALARINRIAAGCAACGMSGAHVGVLLYNSPEYVFLTFALAKIGAVKVPVNMKLSIKEKLYVIRQSECRFVISHDTEKLPPASLKETAVERMIVRFGKEEDTKTGIVIGWDRFLEMGQEMDAPVLVYSDPDGISDILYTSGSTTFPKGVMLTHDLLLRSSFATCRTRRMETGRRILAPIPLYHIFAYNEGLLAAMWAGGCIVLADRKADGAYILELLKKSRANDIICVPVIMIHLLEAIGDEPQEFPDLHAGYWASTCPDWVWDAAKKKLGIEDVTTGYGMTECGSTTTMSVPGCTTEELKTGQGRLKDSGCAGSEAYGGRLVEVEIRDMETGRNLPAGETGELYCRGLTVMKGYYKNPEANKACFDPEGWFATGDVGVMDMIGRFTFQGRKDSMYKINGENVSPQYLNYVIGGCSQVKAVETIGIQNPRYGEVGVAFIELSSDTKENRNKVSEYISEHLADFQLPKYIVSGDSGVWPRTACGKISPGELRKDAALQVERFEKNHMETGRKEIIWI